MNEHVSAWLEAYHDGELQGRHLQQVKSHLAECAACRAELDTLRTLSALLQSSPAVENLTSAERFVAQVGLRLPRHQHQPAWWQAAHVGWRLAPIGLFGAWAFLQAVFLVAGGVLLALRWGGEPALQSAAWLNRLGAGLNDVAPVGLAPVGLDGAFPLGWGGLLYLGLMVLIGALYLSWLASWWARQYDRHNAD
jgi:anti-sigma factor RsiW